MSSAVAAAAAYRGNTLFVHYSTSTNPLGTLYALSSPPGNTTAGPLNSLLAQTQSLTFNGPNPFTPNPSRLTPISASMVSTSTLDPQTRQYRHDLLLAFNMPQVPLQIQPATPFLLRMTPQSPNKGDGQLIGAGNSSSTWTLTDQSQALGMVPGDASRLWMASGIASLPGVGQSIPLQPEGSAVYQIASSTSSLTQKSTVQKIDVSNTGGGLPSMQIFSHDMPLLDSSSNPQMVRIIGSALYDAAIVGRCTATALPDGGGTCLVL
ncbi:hypothetical protein BGX28_006914, partial [Mortierella sp. GBA30]